MLRDGGEAASETPQVARAAAPGDTPPGGVRTGRDGEDDDGPSVAVTGRVVSAADEAPIGGAVVLLRRHGDDEDDAPREQIARSDDDGEFRLDAIAPGRYAVSATGPGHLPAVLRVLDVGEAAPDPITLRMDAGGRKIHGTVADMTGGTIEGAIIRAVPLGGFAALRDHEGFATLTGEDGAYALFVAAGRYRLEVSHPDYASRAHSVEIGAGDLRQDFELVPTGVIEGVVIEAAGGAPVPGARVSWSRERFVVLPGGVREPVRADGGVVMADASGRFRIRGLQPGLVTLGARASKRASAGSVTVPVAIAEHVDGVEIAVVEAFDLGGRVVSEGDDARGIAGAGVSIGTGGEMDRGATTDAEGHFRIEGVLAGHYSLMAMAAGYGLMFPGIDVDVEGDRDDLELRLDPGLKIRGRVEPAELAQVSLQLRPESMRLGAGMFMLGGGGEVESAEDGSFELGPVKPGVVTVMARAADGRVGEAEVEVGDAGADGVIIRLEPRVRVSGTLRGTDGQPVAQAQVSLRPRQAHGKRMRLTVNGREMGVDASATADDGSFEITGLHAGDYEVAIVDRHGDALELREGPVDSSEGAPLLAVPEHDRDGVALVVDAHSGVIAGTVRTGDGEPAADVWVTLSRRPDLPKPRPADEGPREESHQEMRMIVGEGGILGSGERPPVLTGDDGTFEFTGLRDGDYELVAELGGGSARTTATAHPGDRVTLELAPLCAVEGEVTLNGEPAKDFVVSVTGPSARSTHVRDAGGHFRIERLDPGPYQLTVRAGTGSGEASFTVAPGDVAERDVVLAELARIKGTVTDDGGAPIEGAMILVGEGSPESGEISIEADGSEGIITTDAEGAFEIRCAEGARVMVAVRPGEPRPIVMKFFAAKAGETTELGTLTPARDGPPERLGGPETE